MALINLATLGENPRDIGVMINFTPMMEGDEENPWIFSVGAFNGSGANAADNNTEKDFFVSVRKKFGALGFGGSYITGDFDNPDATTNERNRWTADVSYSVSNWMVEGQWGAGDGNYGFAGGTTPGWMVDGNEVEGGFVQLTFMPTDNPWKIFARWQTYDADTNVSDNTTTGFLIGFAYDWDENIRLIAAYERLDTDGVPDATDLFTLRLQGTFN
jgi:predicted porin